MISTTDGTSTTGTMYGTSAWGFVIFFLLLFWFWGGNGFGFGRGAAGAFAADNASDANRELQRHTHDCAQRNERDVLEMGTTLANQTNDITKTLAAMQYEQKAQTERILDGQKDLYIKDLERAATQQFITAQTTSLTNRMDALAASEALARQNDYTNSALARQADSSAAALARQNDMAQLQAQIAAIGANMLTKPTVQACCGLPSVTCTNTGCGCSSL